MGVAVFRDRYATHQLHDEVRSPGAPACGSGRARVKHLGDVRMVHHRQGLPLSLEAGDDLASVHTRLDNLDGHLAAHGVMLLSDKNETKAPFTDLLHQLVRTNYRPWPFDQ